MMEEAPKRRRWYQFRLRMLLIAILVLSLPLSWYTWEVKRVKRQREIGSIIESAGCVVSYEDAEPSVPQRIREFLGDDSVDRVVTAVLVNEEWEEPVVPGLDAPIGWDAFGDDEATYLKELPNLKILSLSNTQVSDVGLEHLKGLTNLDTLFLRNTQVSDAGLEHLEGLTSLKVLYLNDTQVTHDGVKKLQDALPNCKVIEY